jgi:hypothetical protein
VPPRRWRLVRYATANKWERDNESTEEKEEQYADESSLRQEFEAIRGG